MMIKRLVLWGVTSGIVGAVIGDVTSYGDSVSAALQGCGVGIVIGVAGVFLFSR